MSLVPSAEQRGAEFFRDFGALFDHIGIMMVAVLSVRGPHAVQIDLVCHFFAAEHFLISRDTFKNRFHGGNIFRKQKLKLFLPAFTVPDADVPAVPAPDKIRPFELPQFRAPDADRLLQRHQPRVSRVFLLPFSLDIFYDFRSCGVVIAPASDLSCRSPRLSDFFHSHTRSRTDGGKICVNGCRGISFRIVFKMLLVFLHNFFCDVSRPLVTVFLSPVSKLLDAFLVGCPRQIVLDFRQYALCQRILQRRVFSSHAFFSCLKNTYYC